MPEVNEYAPGTPSWVDLATTDPEGSRAFYGAVLGWEFVDLGPDAGGYSFCTLNGKQVAGLGPTQGEGMPSAWSSYVSVDDADVTAKAVEAAGGTALAPPFDVMEAGRMAVFADPTGAAVSVWQPKQTKGAELVNEPGAWCCNELDTRDLDAAKEFYQSVFGWEPVTSDMGEMSYTEFKLDGKSIGGMMAMPDQVPAEVPSFWLVYFAVADTDATVAKVTELGGGVSMPAMDSPAGRFAVVRDPAGAVFGVIKM
jgi:uncharacterized protein